MLVSVAFFALGALSGFAAYRLSASRKKGRPRSVPLIRLATVLAYCWFAISALLFAWAAWRLAS